MNLEQKRARMLELHRKINEKELFYYRKWHRARNPDIADRHFAKYQQFSKAISRLLTIRDLLTPMTPLRREVRHDMELSSFRYRLIGKEKRKHDFLNKHRYGIWFMSNSLGADYGTFACDRCGDTFYHSPSRISKGLERVYECCCGYCTNEIISRDWNEKPFG